MNIGSLGLVRSGVSVGIARTNNYNAARNHFTEFLKFTDLMSSEFEGTLEEWLATLEEPNAICDVEIVQQFATYLEKYARKSTDNKPLAKGTIMDILSSLKTLFNHSLFIKNTIFQDVNDWYTRMRSNTKNQVTRRDMRRGTRSTSRSKPIGREQLKDIMNTLLGQNTITSLRKGVYLGATFNSSARTSELCYLCDDDGTFWDLDFEMLFFNQKEMKVAEEKMNCFVSDSSFYQLDQYWLFAIYYMLGGGQFAYGPNNAHENFIFPELFSKED